MSYDFEYGHEFEVLEVEASKTVTFEQPEKWANPFE